MRGLLLKDILSIKKELKLFCLILILYVGICVQTGEMGLLFIFGVLSTMSTVSLAISYDEKAGWNSYAIGMKLKYTDIVFSKYVLGLIVAIGSTILIGMIQLFIGINTNELVFTIGGTLIASILILSVIIPIYLNFGVEKGKIVNMIVILLPTILTIFLKDKILDRSIEIERFLRFILNYGILIGGIIAIVVLVMSIIVSIRIVKNKEY